MIVNYIPNMYSDLKKNMGLIAGIIPITILTQKNDINNTEKTLWNTSQARYVRYDTAGVTTIVSASDEDKMTTGTGIWTVKVSGLNNDYEFIQEVVELNGITPVILTNQFLAVNEINPELAGSLKTAQGNISVLRGTDVLSLIDATTENNISRQIIFTVPAGAELKVTSVELTTGTSDELTFRLYAVNPLNGIRVLQHTLFFSGGVFVQSLKGSHLTFPEKHFLEGTAQANLGVASRKISCIVSGDLIIKNQTTDLQVNKL